MLISNDVVTHPRSDCIPSDSGRAADDSGVGDRGEVAGDQLFRRDQSLPTRVRRFPCGAIICNTIGEWQHRLLISGPHVHLKSPPLITVQPWAPVVVPGDDGERINEGLGVKTLP